MWSGTYNAILFAVAAAAFAFLLLLILLAPRAGLTRILLAGACALTAGSAAATAAGWGGMLDPGGTSVELARTIGWCGFIFHLLRRQRATKLWTLRIAMLCGLSLALTVVAIPMLTTTEYQALAITGELSARLGFAIYGFLLIENLYRNASEAGRWHLNFLCVAVGGIFAYQILLYSDALMYHQISGVLYGGEAIALTIAVPLLAVSIARNRSWAVNIHVSRNIVFHTATLLVSGVFLLALALTGEVFRAAGPSWGELVEMVLLITGVVTISILLTSGSARSFLRHTLAENLYSHRYDYRREWLKSIEVLSIAKNEISVQTRVIRAVAEIADSPAGALWVRDVGAGSFQWSGSWNWPDIVNAQSAADEFVSLFRGGEWVVELDETSCRPEWLEQLPAAWLAVPLAQQQELIGFVILARSRAPLTLDRETFDLLRIVAQQSATHIAESRSAQALADVKQLSDYSKRFAFVVHDMKNVAYQLNMILQNARSHKNNPEFQQDVLATIAATVEKLNRLLIRLRASGSSSSRKLIVPAHVIGDVLDQLSHHRVPITLQDAAPEAAIVMDEMEFRSVLVHLCENALEAAEAGVQVRIRSKLSLVEIDIEDDGPGMQPEFIRDMLFRPLFSEKKGGFGIGAYQARELLRAARGDLLVMKGHSGGTIMRIVLPSFGENIAPEILESRLQ